ncbi:hypothetical protein SPHV1_2250034 [Novosphingobium sp. KN65.2]|nr:hypothetical protein SPHV1_2250034 [Novosphingobium sp. KN65.2]
MVRQFYARVGLKVRIAFGFLASRRQDALKFRNSYAQVFP